MNARKFKYEVLHLLVRLKKFVVYSFKAVMSH